MNINEIIDKDGRPSRSKSGELGLMEQHQDWVRMHADTHIVSRNGSLAMSRFLSMVESLIPPAKYKIFRSILRDPLPTTPIVETVFDRLSRIFEGRNPVYNYQFTDKSCEEDWDKYRKEVLDEPNVWREKAWEYFKTEPNSVLVVDMPVAKDGGAKYVSPYYYWVCTKDILDYRTDESGNITMLMYKNDDQHVLYIVDTEYYRSFDYDGDTVDMNSERMTENRHNLGYCPAAFFLSDPVSLASPDIKRSPITKVLSDLDWYIFDLISSRHLGLYAQYPIYSGYEQDCDYEAEIQSGDSKTHVHCKSGMLVDDDGNAVLNPLDGTARVCPKCHGAHNTSGPGTWITVPIPDTTGDIPNMIEAVKMLKADVNSLEFTKEKLEASRNAIINACVGVEGNVFSEFSISEKQVDANYESQSTILIRVKKEFENAQWFVDDTVCRLRYGSKYTSCQINYGTEFYTLSTEQLRKRFKEAKESGASQGDLISLNKQILETEYRTDPLMMERMITLADIEPLVGMTVDEAVARMDKGLVDPSDVKVKANFESLIKRFERENGNVMNFGSNVDYANKIETIKNTLKQYTNEIRPIRSNEGELHRVAEESGSQQ